MAYIDATLQFSDSQALTADAVSADVIDLTVNRDVGPGRHLWVVVKLETALGGTSPTLEVQLQTDDNSSFSSATTIATSQAFTPAQIVDNNDQIVVAVPFDNERYLRLNYNVSGTSPTATVTSYLTDQDPYSWKSYPDGQN